MKHLLLILTFTLSCLFSDRESCIPEQNTSVTSTVIETDRPDSRDRDPLFNSPALLPLQSASYSGGNSSITPAFRSNGSGRRTQTSQKSLFLIVKTGKVIDRNLFHIFQEELHQFQTGINSKNRYIHTICRLLI